MIAAIAVLSLVALVIIRYTSHQLLEYLFFATSESIEAEQDYENDSQSGLF